MRRSWMARALGAALLAFVVATGAVVGAPRVALAQGPDCPEDGIELSASVVTPEKAYDAIVALKSQYPNGTPWTNDNSYYSEALHTLGYGCAGFAFMASDAAFGDNPATYYYDLGEVRVGDILRINYDTHSVVVLEVRSNGVVVAEGNLNSAIYWGRFISFSEMGSGFVYGITRYIDPETITFPDVAEGEWYYTSVKWAVENGVMSGHDDGLFRPLDVIRREDMAVVLYRYLRGESDAPSCGLTDVVEDYYTPAVNWCVAEGIFSGYGDGTFGVGRGLTREQLAAVLYRLSGKPAATGDLDVFPDGNKTSEPMRTAMRWAVGAGLISGYDSGELRPTDPVTRGMAVTIVRRWAQS